MKRFYKLLISTLVIIGFVATEPTETPVEKTDQQVCAIKPGCCVSDQIVDADVKKAFRLKAQGKDNVDDKDSRGVVDEELESFLESVSDNPKYQMKPRGPNAPSWVTGVKPKIVKKEAANRHPYQDWLTKNRKSLLQKPWEEDVQLGNLELLQGNRAAAEKLANDEL